MITALGNLGLTRLQLGHDEAAVAALRASAAASRNADADEFDPRIVGANNANSLALAALRTADPGEALRQANLAIGGINRAFRLGAYEYALRALALAHDHAAAARLARRAEFSGAELERRAPRWADPLKYLGDAAVRRGSEREAERLYAAAAERAPRWGALHGELGRVLWRLGRRDEARTKFAAVAAMDLSAADRVRLARLVAFVTGRRA